MSNAVNFVDTDLAYRLLLGRKNRAGMPPPPELDAVWRLRIDAAIERLNAKGIALTETVEDAMLVADYAVFLDESREKSGAMPDELRMRIRERWLSEGGAE